MGSERDPKCLARVGAGAAVIMELVLNTGVISIGRVATIAAQVPGNLTVPRAELWVVLQLLGAYPPDKEVTINIDASYVVDGGNNLCKGLCGVNADLWLILADIKRQRTADTHFVNVQSHLDDKDPGWLDINTIKTKDVLGNALADGVADAAAGWRQQLDKSTIKEQQDVEDLTMKIALRLACIQQIHWDTGKGIKNWEMPPVTEAKEYKHDIIAAGLSQQLYQSGNRDQRWKNVHKCEHCKKFRCDNKFNLWLKVPCIPIMQVTEVVYSNKRNGLNTTPPTSLTIADKRRKRAPVVDPMKRRCNWQKRPRLKFLGVRDMVYALWRCPCYPSDLTRTPPALTPRTHKDPTMKLTPHRVFACETLRPAVQRLKQLRQALHPLEKTQCKANAKAGGVYRVLRLNQGYTAAKGKNVKRLTVAPYILGMMTTMAARTTKSRKQARPQ